MTPATILLHQSLLVELVVVLFCCDMSLRIIRFISSRCRRSPVFEKFGHLFRDAADGATVLVLGASTAFGCRFPLLLALAVGHFCYSAKARSCSVTSWRRVFGVLVRLIPMIVFFWPPYHGNGQRIGEASNLGPRSLKICSFNVTSLRLHLSEIQQLDWDVACIQETGCNTSNVRNVSTLCRESGIELFHGPLLASHQTGGVAICSKAYPRFDAYTEHSDMFDSLLESKMETRRYSSVQIKGVKFT